MDPAFVALLNDLKAKGFTDQMFGWIQGQNPADWEASVRTIESWLTSGRYTPEQIAGMKAQGSFAAANSYLNPPAQSMPVTPNLETTPVEPPTTPETPNASAFATVRRMLEDFGLGGLADWAWKRYQEGASLDTINIELYQRPEFKAQYPEYEVLAGKGRAYSVGELNAYRKAVVGIFRSYGVPTSFYDQPSDLAAFAAGEVSVAEISKRVAQAAEAVYQASPLVRAEMERMYGVGTGDLVAYFLDPSKAEPIIKQNYTAAQIGAAARQTTYGTLTTDEAQRLAGQGVDQQRALEGFNTLAQSRELFNPVSMDEQQIGRDVQLGAAFGGDAEAQQTVDRRRGRRLAEFNEGGGFATTREGIAGVA